MEIRTAVQEDVKAINEIYNQAIQDGLTADTGPLDVDSTIQWFQQYDRKIYPVFVVIADSSVVGWLSFSPYRPGRMALRHTTEISYYIHKDYQRKKIGTQLLAFAIDNSAAYNFRNLFAIILEKNAGSIKLLEKSGFEKWGFMPGVADFEGKLFGHLYYGTKIKE